VRAEKWNGRNLQEEVARRFGLSNAECLADPRIGRLINYKISLKNKIISALAADVRPLGTAAGFSLEELDRLDSRVFSVLKSIRDSQRHLAVLCPMNKTPNQGAKKCPTK
jgi:hypothetical protein